MSNKMTQIATLFAAGSFLAATATPLGATPVPTSAGTPASLEAFGSGACGGQEAMVDKDKQAADAKVEGKKASDAKKAGKKGMKEGSCGAGSCGGKMKKGDKKMDAHEKKAEAPAKQ